MANYLDQLANLSSPDIELALDDLSPADIDNLAYDWSTWRRSTQAPPPGDWRFWLILTGRAWGKTRVGAEWVREKATSGDYKYVNLIGATVDDARDIMIEGESGILNICPPNERPEYIISKRRLEWPNGCRSLIFTADEPKRLRGKQHQCFWADELAQWGKQGDAWIQAKLGLRLPPNPQAVITTTPQPIALLKRLVADPNVVVTRGTVYENVGNLDPAYFKEIITEYEGTSLGRQELEGHLLEEAEGALWKRTWIDQHRLTVAPLLARIAVGVDPSGGGESECGIFASGVRTGRDHPEWYNLTDASGLMSSAQWGIKVWRTALSIDADIVVAEKNFGGDMVLEVLRSTATHSEFSDCTLPPVKLVSASRGKLVRAEPWSAKAQQGKLHHVGTFDELEDELCNYDGTGKSPNRLDAMVWALSELDSKPKRKVKLTV